MAEQNAGDTSSPNPAATETRIDALGSEITRIGHYSLTRLLGSGGMGAVYEAIQDRPRRVVAVKLMRTGIDSARELRRFEYEAQILARLQHPSIAQIYEAGTHLHRELKIPYAMEFISGAQSITDYARTQKRTVRERLELFIRVCDALQHAHDKGILHRDLKPANILVDGSGCPKVIDFGIARAVDADQTPTTLQTNPEQLLGTLQYMAPEQIGGDPRQLDARADVYALGVVLFELLCGRLPYDVTRSRLAEASRVIHEDAPLLPRSLNAQLNSDLETVLLKALHKDRTRRYQSARDLADDVRRTLDDQPIAAKRDSLAYLLQTRGRLVVRRHQVGYVVLAIVLAWLIAELIGLASEPIWRPTAKYERWAILHLTSFPTDPALHDVRVIALSDSTNLDGLAAAANVQRPAGSDRKWLRAVRGALLSRLASAGPRLVVFDHYFEGAALNYDDVLNRGIDALAREKIEVVIGTRTWDRQSDGSPQILASMRNRVRVGALSAGTAAGDPWHINLALVRGQPQAMPSLALEAFAATRAPFTPVMYGIDTRTNTVEMSFGADPGTVALRHQDVPMTHWLQPDPTSENAHLRGGDLIAKFVIPMPANSVLKNSTIDMLDALRADDAALRAMVGGKIIVFADELSSGTDVHTYGDGRRLFGAEAQAAAIDMLVNDQAIVTPAYVRLLGMTLSTRVLLEAAASVLGAAAALIYLRRDRRAGRRTPFAAIALRTTWLVALAGLVAGACLLSYREARMLYCPLIPLVAILTSFEFTNAVRRIGADRVDQATDAERFNHLEVADDRAAADT